MTGNNAWAFPFPKGNQQDPYKNFCLDRCPHPDNPCKGDCPEMKKFRKNRRKENNGKL